GPDARHGASRARRHARPHSHRPRAGVRARGAAHGAWSPGHAALAPRHVERLGGVRHAGGAARADVPSELRAVPRARARRRARGGPGALTRFEVVRDPLWNNIRLDPEALAVVDTPAVQRLRDVRPDSEERARLKLAALLHDIGHYPFSHALEEAGLPRHEALAARHLTSGALADRLTELGTPAERLLPLIRGEARGPLVGLVAGSLDVDK